MTNSQGHHRHRGPRSDEELRRGAGTRRARPDRRRRRGARLPRPQRRRQVDDHPGPARPGARRLAAPSRLLGGDPWTDAVALHRQIAYVPGDVTLWPSLTGGETIDLLARMRGGIDEQRRAELIERFDLDPTKKARTYSKGNRQKVSLVSAFSSHARLLLLDEPSSGLDPLMENVFQQCVAEARDRGATVLLSSHILAETEALCERVTIIRAGRTVESGTLESMRHLSRTSIKAEMIGDPGDHRPASRASRTSASTATPCAPRSTATASARSSRCSATPASAAWSASRRRWRTCSCGTTTSGEQHRRR